jgi:hypothetical protein
MRALFDLSFSRFVVPRLVRWLYLGCLALAALALVGALASAIPAAMSEQIVLDALEASGAPARDIERASTRRNFAIAAAVGAPFLALGLVLVGRVAAEMTVVVFSIAESLRRDR